MEAIPLGIAAHIPLIAKAVRVASFLLSLVGVLGVYTGLFFFIILYYQSPNPTPIELLWLFPNIFYLGAGIPTIAAALYNNRWSVIGNYAGAMLGWLVFMIITIYGAVLQWGVLSHCSNPTVGSFDVYFCNAKPFLDGFLSIIVISWVVSAGNLLLAAVDFAYRGILSGPRLPGQPDIPLVGTHMHEHRKHDRVDVEQPVQKKHHNHPNMREADFYDDDD